jgi:hypothetical protein
MAISPLVAIQYVPGAADASSTPTAGSHKERAAPMPNRRLAGVAHGHELIPYAERGACEITGFRYNLKLLLIMTYDAIWNIAALG